MKSFFKQYSQFFVGGILVLIGALAGVGVIRYTDRTYYDDYYDYNYYDEYPSYIEEIDSNNEGRKENEAERTESEERVVRELKSINGITIQLVEKDIFTYWGGEVTSSEIFLRRIALDGSKKDLLHIEPLRVPVFIDNLKLSPLGKYLSFSVEDQRDIFDYLLNTDTGNNLLNKYTKLAEIENSGKYVKDVFWSDDEKALAYVANVDGAKRWTLSVYVSEFGNPEKINEIFSLDDKENSNIREIRNMTIDGNLVYFVAIDIEKGEVLKIYDTVSRSFR